MNTVDIKNSTGTQVEIDGILYELPNRINTILEFSEHIVIHCISSVALSDHLFQAGAYSLFCFGKKINALVWKIKDTISIRRVYLPAKKDESWFGTKEQYQKYLDEFKQEELLSVWDGDFVKIIDPSNGNILSSAPHR